jgi:hypothetical protein
MSKCLEVKKLKRISIFAGNFGSGKTEIALNYAAKIHETGDKVVVVDLDLINPYFRTRLVKKNFEDKGIKVVSPEGKLANADVPALSPAIYGVLEGKNIYGVFDVGGGDIGSVVLGRFTDHLPEGTYNLFLVVNTCRPFTRDTDGIITVLREIEKTCRLKFTAIVSNTNLGPGTDTATVLEGYRIASEAARILNLPVAFVCVPENLIGSLKGIDVPVLPLTMFMKVPWLI